MLLDALRDSGNLILLMCLRSLARKVDLIFVILKLIPVFIVSAGEEQVCGDYN